MYLMFILGNTLFFSPIIWTFKGKFHLKKCFVVIQTMFMSMLFVDLVSLSQSLKIKQAFPFLWVSSLLPKKELDMVDGWPAVYHTSKNLIRCDCSCTVQSVSVSTAVSHSVQLVHYIGLAAVMAVTFFHLYVFTVIYTCVVKMSSLSWFCSDEIPLKRQSL